MGSGDYIVPQSSLQLAGSGGAGNTRQKGRGWRQDDCNRHWVVLLVQSRLT